MKSPAKNRNGLIKSNGVFAGRGIVVSSSPALARRYQSLLLNDWKKDTLNKTISLLWDEVSSRAKPDVPWLEVLRPLRSGIAQRETYTPIVERLKALASIVPSDFLPHISPPPATSSNGRRSKILAQAETAWTYLVLQHLTRVSGDMGFLLDTQSVLFLLVLDELLPLLRKQKRTWEHACLVAAMGLFTLNFLHDQQAHYHYLRSLLMNYFGEKKERQGSMLHAFRLTAPQDHSFLTKAQAYCDSLLEDGKVKHALEFLIELHRQALPKDKQEIEEMILSIRPRALAGRY